MSEKEIGNDVVLQMLMDSLGAHFDAISPIYTELCGEAKFLCSDENCPETSAMMLFLITTAGLGISYRRYSEHLINAMRQKLGLSVEEFRNFLADATKEYFTKSPDVAILAKSGIQKLRSTGVVVNTCLRSVSVELHEKYIEELSNLFKEETTNADPAVGTGVVH